MMIDEPKTVYEVWATQGQGGIKESEHPTLEEALAYVTKHKGEASFAIKYPNGSWYDWEWEDVTYDD